MPTPLAEQEIQAVLRMKVRFACALEIQLGPFEQLDTPVPLQPEFSLPTAEYRSREASAWLEAGAHHLALALHENILLELQDPATALAIAISALLWNEMELAEEWALRSWTWWKKVGQLTEFDHPWYRHGVHTLQLAKVFRALGKLEHEHDVRTYFKAHLFQIHTDRDPGMDALRLAVELGYGQEADTLARFLAPLYVGHSRYYLTLRLFRALLKQDKETLAWAVIAMTTDNYDETGLRYSAIEASCEQGNYALALKFAAHNGYAEHHGDILLSGIARWLVARDRLQDWPLVWNLLIDPKSGLDHRYPTDHKLHFLAKIVEHVHPGDRSIMFRHAHRIHRSAASMPNREYAQRIFDKYVQIAAWGASKPSVRKLAPEISKDLAAKLIRPAVARGMDSILRLIPDLRTKANHNYTFRTLEIEWERKRHGKSHRLEQVFNALFHQAIQSNSHSLRYSLFRFAGSTWKNMDLYRELLKRYPPTFDNIGTYWPMIKPPTQAGDLLMLEAELARIQDAHILNEASRDFQDCLKNRFGLMRQLEDF